MTALHDATLLTILGSPAGTAGKQRKISIAGPVWLSTHGLENEQGIREYYEDTDSALLHYPLEHYDYWARHYPALGTHVLSAGLVGENFSSRGMRETALCVGDIFQLGKAIIQISSGREACQKMAQLFNDPRVPDIMHRESRNGWFYRVLAEGYVTPGDRFYLQERPAAEWPISRLQKIIFDKQGTASELSEIADMPFLATSWRQAVTLCHTLPDC